MSKIEDGVTDEKPNATEYHRPEWIWYCESTSGVPVVSLGRWAKHPQQARYKLADVQATEHDHPARDIDWGGQAFPTEGGSDSGLYPDPGMSLRDYFAGQAISQSTSWWSDEETRSTYASRAYLMADAMITARKATPEELTRAANTEDGDQ